MGPCHFKGGPLFVTKARASRVLLNDNALKNQLVFTTEETWSIKPNDWLLCLPLLIGWKAASCSYNSEGNWWSEEERGGKKREEGWKQQIKNSWLVSALRPDENIKTGIKCQTLTSGWTMFIQGWILYCVFPQAEWGHDPLYVVNYNIGVTYWPPQCKVIKTRLIVNNLLRSIRDLHKTWKRDQDQSDMFASAW